MNTKRQQFQAVVKNGKLEFQNKTGLIVWCELLEGKEVNVIIEKVSEVRTAKQNSSIHLYCQHLAEAFEEAGLDMKQVIHANIPPTMENIKENIWKKVQRSMFGKKSTTELTKQEVSQVYETINRFVGQEWHLDVPFPSEVDERYN